MKNQSIIVLFLALAGCSNYDSYAECVQRELKGDSKSALTAARAYCGELMEKKRVSSEIDLNQDEISKLEGSLSFEENVIDSKAYGEKVYYLMVEVNNKNEFSVHDLVVSYKKSDGTSGEFQVGFRGDEYFNPNSKRAARIWPPALTPKDVEAKGFEWWISSGKAYQE